MYNKELSVSLLTDNNNIFTEFNKDGRVFVEGRKGSNYKIRVQNHTNSKIKAIISVDGLDILSGKRATASSAGYVLEPYQTQEFAGWRINDNEIRKFFFTSQKNSYNKKTGNDTSNLGVIGVMAFKEYKYDWSRLKVQLYSPESKFSFDSWNPIVGHTAIANLSTSSPTISGSVGSASMMQLQNASEVARVRSTSYNAPVGTGMGAKETSSVTKVSLTWENSPFSICQIYYKSRKELEAMGVIVTVPKTSSLPSAFEGYCPQI